MLRQAASHPVKLGFERKDLLTVIAVAGLQAIIEPQGMASARCNACLCQP